MNIHETREQLALWTANLPDSVQSKLLDIKLDIPVMLGSICDTQEFVIYETGGIYEGVWKIFTGEDSPSNFVAFIEKDERIEEDNRPKIATLAYEIQTKLFDPVLPILKQAGLPVKEGRVAQPPKQKLEVLSSKLEEGVPSPYAQETQIQDSRFKIQENKIPPASESGLPLGKGESVQPPLEDKNVRALLKIASGTNYSEEQLKEAFLELPQGLRQSLSSVDTANAIQAIAKKYFLHVDQMASLASETGLILLGLTHPGAFIGNLATRLRLPEEKTKEIARDISAQILVKVREALRGLHENAESSKLEARSSKNEAEKSQTTNQKTTEPLQRIEVMPRSQNEVARPPLQSQSSVGQGSGKYEVRKEAQPQKTPSFVTEDTATGSSLEQEAKSYQPVRTDAHPGGLKASLQTPYTTGAKWNTGDNILNRQATQKTESLSRDEVLKGIENPIGITNNQETITTKRPEGVRENVGPTGWKPATADGGKFQITSTKSQTNSNAQIPNTKTTQRVPIPQKPVLPLSPVIPKAPAPATPAEKARPQSESATPPIVLAEKKSEGEMDFLDQKLQAPMAMPRTEKRYTTDPYREPLQ
ncbi:MAG: hypothetical protein Q7R64_00820 [bacterium]|nr:hypothetical protein [bacterium]